MSQENQRGPAATAGPRPTNPTIRATTNPKDTVPARLGCAYGCGSFHEDPCPNTSRRAPLDYMGSLRARDRFPRGERDYDGSAAYVMRDGIAHMVTLAEYNAIHTVDHIPQQRAA